MRQRDSTHVYTACTRHDNGMIMPPAARLVQQLGVRNSSVTSSTVTGTTVFDQQLLLLARCCTVPMVAVQLYSREASHCASGSV